MIPSSYQDRGIEQKGETRLVFGGLVYYEYGYGIACSLAVSIVSYKPIRKLT